MILDCILEYKVEINLCKDCGVNDIMFLESVLVNELVLLLNWKM